MPAPLASPSASNDAPLVERIALGDPAALTEFYRRHCSRVMAIAIHLLKNRGEAEEVLQETFLAIWQQASRYDRDRASPEHWLSMMVRSRALDRLRNASARLRLADTEARSLPPPQAPIGVEHIEGRERAARIAAALTRLPREQRRVVELAYFEGLTQREIAEQTTLPLGTVKTRIRLGMEKLSALLR